MTKTASKQSGKFRRTLPKPKHRKLAKSAAHDLASRQKKLAGAGPSNRLPSNEPCTGSKQARLIAMLRATAGTTISVMMQTVGWQQHSVRGFLAGVVRKKLGLNLVSEVSERGRVYRVADRLTGAKTNEAA